MKIKSKNKESLKKAIGYAQIYLLIMSIVSFSFIMNAGFVEAPATARGATATAAGAGVAGVGGAGGGGGGGGTAALSLADIKRKIAAAGTTSTASIPGARAVPPGISAVPDSLRTEIDTKARSYDELTTEAYKLKAEIDKLQRMIDSKDFSGTDLKEVVAVRKRDGIQSNLAALLARYDFSEGIPQMERVVTEVKMWQVSANSDLCRYLTGEELELCINQKMFEGGFPGYSPLPPAELTRLQTLSEETKEEIETTQRKQLAEQVGSSTISKMFHTTPGGFPDAILSSAQWAVLAFGASQALGTLIGAADKNFGTEQQQKLSLAFSTGAAVWKLLDILGNPLGAWGKRSAIGRWFGRNSGWVGAAVGIGIFLAMYETVDTKTRILEYQCLAWQAPSGDVGRNSCHLCNDEELPCSEYRCKSLGATCGLINVGTEEEKCIDTSPYDVTSPGIRAVDEFLTSGYEYGERRDRPPGGEENAGIRIQREGGGCINAFQTIQFGIETFGVDDNPEPAQCKFDINHTDSYDEMAYYLGDSNLYVTNHTQKIYLPSAAVVNDISPEVNNDGLYTWYIRCKDGNENENRDEFAVRFCVDDGPDLTAPEIKETNPINYAPVQYRVDNLSVSIFVSEPAECKWSNNDADYEVMQIEMDCSNAIYEIDANQYYVCTSILTGIKDRQDNDFYFRCTDLNNNTMRQSYHYVLKGTQPLDIIELKPNGTIGGSTSTVNVSLEVKTDNGYNNGDAKCFWKQGDEEYQEFYSTDSNRHNQSLNLQAGNYTFDVLCIDLGGNNATNKSIFNVFVDTFSPNVVRAYYEGDKVKIKTQEDSECSYSTQSCNFDFDEGISMPYAGRQEHYAEWKTATRYYIKCQDEYGNLPNPSECSIILNPYNRENSED